jgi:hypothetical protein
MKETLMGHEMVGGLMERWKVPVFKTFFMILFLSSSSKKEFLEEVTGMER